MRATTTKRKFQLTLLIDNFVAQCQLAGISEKKQAPYLQVITSFFQRKQKTDPQNKALFFQSSEADQDVIELTILCYAVLNADLDVVKAMLANKSSDDIKKMLSKLGTAIIEHLGIERTGTPLQMTLYSHDEILFKLLADQMDPAEVQLQCKAVFDHYKVADYDGLMKKLDADASTLCSELEAAFALNHISGTTSALQDVLNRFSISLDQYVRNNPVHNPYVLQRLLEIYEPKYYDVSRQCLLSQQAIGFAQKLSSARWLQHNAQGIYHLGNEKNAPAPLFSFSCQGFPTLDIRSQAVLPSLGVDSCIDIRGFFMGSSGRYGGYMIELGLSVAKLYQNFCREKTASLENLCSQRNHDVSDAISRQP